MKKIMYLSPNKAILNCETFGGVIKTGQIVEVTERDHDSLLKTNLFETYVEKIEPTPATGKKANKPEPIKNKTRGK